MSSSISMPSAGRVYFPLRISCGTTRLTVSTGTAKPMPALVPLGLYIAVLMPISRPAESSKGPPEFPGLMAALVWIRCWTVTPFSSVSERSSAETMPLVNVQSRPKGLPIA